MAAPGIPYQLPNKTSHRARLSLPSASGTVFTSYSPIPFVIQLLATLDTYAYTVSSLSWHLVTRASDDTSGSGDSFWFSRVVARKFSLLFRIFSSAVSELVKVHFDVVPRHIKLPTVSLYIKLERASPLLIFLSATRALLSHIRAREIQILHNKDSIISAVSI